MISSTAPYASRLVPGMEVSDAVDLVGRLLLTLGVEIDPSRLRRALGARRGQRKKRPRQLSISRLCRQYLAYAEGYYLPTDCSSGRESACIERALRPVRKLFGRTPVASFGPRRLKAVRDEMIGMGWCRRSINQQIGRVKRMLKWATENEMIPPTVFHSVQAVAGLRAGRCAAPESEPVKPVPEPLIEAVLPLLSAPVAAMVRLQVLTGMRPGEVTIMRACDVEATSEVWLYRPSRHKTAHHGHERIVYLGPQAQDVLRPFLLPHSPQTYLFSPKQSEAARRALLTERRVTPMSCGNRRGTNRKRRPKKTPGDRYDTHAYARSVTYACRKAFPVPEGASAAEAKAWRRERFWHPHQLRHNAATRFRKMFGLDVAQVLLGHKTLAVTQVYAEKDEERARRIVAAAG